MPSGIGQHTAGIATDTKPPCQDPVSIFYVGWLCDYCDSFGISRRGPGNDLHKDEIIGRKFIVTAKLFQNVNGAPLHG